MAQLQYTIELVDEKEMEKVFIMPRSILFLTPSPNNATSFLNIPF